jgi:hypothetical protein
MRKAFQSMIVLGLVAASALAAVSPAEAQAQGTLQAIPNVRKTPTSLCVPGTMKFVRHDRKALRFSGDTYYQPDPRGDDWDVGRAETDGTKIYWTIPFAAAKPGDPDPYGAGNVYCECQKR